VSDYEYDAEFMGLKSSGGSIFCEAPGTLKTTHHFMRAEPTKMVVAIVYKMNEAVTEVHLLWRTYFAQTWHTDHEIHASSVSEMRRALVERGHFVFGGER
jgi:hypothetical protein